MTRAKPDQCDHLVSTQMIHPSTGETLRETCDRCGIDMLDEDR